MAYSINSSHQDCYILRIKASMPYNIMLVQTNLYPLEQEAIQRLILYRLEVKEKKELKWQAREYTVKLARRHYKGGKMLGNFNAKNDFQAGIYQILIHH